MLYPVSGDRLRPLFRPSRWYVAVETSGIWSRFMLSRIIRRCAGGLALLAGLGLAEASAHPHVWVTVKSELVYAPDGTLTAVRHHWTFDEMFSTFATQGMDD